MILKIHKQGTLIGEIMGKDYWISSPAGHEVTEISKSIFKLCFSVLEDFEKDSIKLENCNSYMNTEDCNSYMNIHGPYLDLRINRKNFPLMESLHFNFPGDMYITRMTKIDELFIEAFKMRLCEFLPPTTELDWNKIDFVISLSNYNIGEFFSAYRIFYSEILNRFLSEKL